MLERTEKIIVSGIGDSKKSAFATALNKVQSEILKGTDDVLLRIEPVNVRVVRGEERQWTEKFFFFFMPRQKTEYSITLEVEVKVSRLQLEKIPFATIKENPRGLRIPLINKTI